MMSKHYTAKNADGWIEEYMKNFKGVACEVEITRYVEPVDDKPWYCMLMTEDKVLCTGEGKTMSEAILAAWHDAVGSELPPF